ncbi:Stf0 family sulfotransferase [Chitinophaga rhizophila]|uniref:Sulfotransferase n=1 Tax=Chitinophaga rhizophila TaxID=2866212 RepID=A0ABS7G8N2_9BACT|nr:Stf0 family sulfotransferase [Chitinophaga rhizophila]MBW8683057.1 sulfotransferase [Chitinophaga rhizophila]
MPIQRFIILGTARTGSNLLISLLSGHQEIRVLGELFNLDTIPPDALPQALDTPVTYMEQQLFRNLSDSKKAVGFKIFYDHFTPDYFKKPVDPQEADEQLRKRFQNIEQYISTHYTAEELETRFSQLWEHLVADKQLKVIHLKRNNKLDTLVSLKTAFVTNQWMAYKAGHTMTTKLELGEEECAQYFNRLEAYEKQYAQMFAAHDILELSYEDLATEQDAVLQRVCQFLDISPGKASTILKKQVTAPIRDVVQNYRALATAFRDTRWAHYFNA